MGLVSSSIPNLANGVSQQAASVRLMSQGQEQINAFSSIISGLRKRPPTEHMATLISNASASDNYFIHTINRDVTERYLVLATNTGLRVFDFAGTEFTVNTPSGYAYLATGNPLTDFKAVTIADYTFLLNKTITTATIATTTTAPWPDGVVHVRQGNYATDYKVLIDDVVKASYTTSATDVTTLKTNGIAQNLGNQLVNSLGSAYTLTLKGNAIRIQRTDGNDFTLTTEDSFGNKALIPAKGSIQRFSDLPAQAFNGFQIEIIGEKASDSDNYYVEYEQGDDAVGVWKETVGIGADNTINPATMPWKLVRNADTSFTFEPNTWGRRLAGDLISAPEPSFIGRKLNDVFFHRNRFGVIADENVIFSRSGKYFEFYPETVTTLLATDPIDVAVSHTKVSILRHAIPFNETLLLFSDQTQFTLSAGDSLTPETVSINQTTEYESSLQAEPVGAGEYVYFATNREGFTGIREFFVQADTASNIAIDATLNVPRYIKGKATSMVSNTNEDMLFVLTDGTFTTPTCYIYKYLRQQGEALQISWSKWEFPNCDKILSIGTIESTVYWVMKRGALITLEKMQLQESPEVTATGKMVYLDALRTGTNELTNQSEVSIDGESFVGYPYTMSYTFSTQYKRSQGLGGSQLTDTSGRLQMRSFKILYENTGRFTVNTASQGATNSYEYTGEALGLQTLGQVSLESGVFAFPVQSKNDRLTITVSNATHYPSAFQSAEWTGFYTTLSRRI
jgi:hypothetical protein